MSFILIVEDEDTVRETLKLTLETDGFRVKAAKDPKEAEVFMLKMRPALIIMDYWLGIDFGDGIIKIAREEFNDPVPIVLCSAWDKIDQVAHANRIKTVVKKPFLIEEMVEKILSTIPITAFYSCHNDGNNFLSSYQLSRNRRSP